MPELVKTSEDLGIRIEEFFEDEFRHGGIHSDYVERVAHYKSDLLRLLQLPSLDSGWLFTTEDFEPSLDIQTTFNHAIELMEQLVEYPKTTISSPDCNEDGFYIEFWVNTDLDDPVFGKTINIDWKKMTYTVEGCKQEKKILRMLRKTHPAIQRRFIKILMSKTSMRRPRDLDELPAVQYINHYFKPDGSGDFDKFWPRVGEVVRPKKRRYLLTCDPVMMLGQSVSESFSSCHAPDGCHKYGPQAYAADTVTVGLFDIRSGTDGDEIFDPRRSNTGRALYYIPNVQEMFYLQARRYGSLDGIDLKIIRDFIGKSLREQNGVLPATWRPLKEGEDSLYIRAPQTTYIDYPSYGKAYVLDGWCKSRIEIPDCLCPVCLGRFYDREGCCLTSYNHHCCECGDGIYDDDVYWGENGDEAYCESCYDAMFTRCHDCGDAVRNEGVYYTAEGYALCGYHWDTSTYTCDRCGNTWFYNPDLVTVITASGEEDWCCTCAHDTEDCQRCGETCADGDGLMNDDGLCEDCAESAEEEEKAHDEL